MNLCGFVGSGLGWPFLASVSLLSLLDPYDITRIYFCFLPVYH